MRMSISAVLAWGFSRLFLKYFSKVSTVGKSGPKCDFRDLQICLPQKTRG